MPSTFSVMPEIMPSVYSSWAWRCALALQPRSLRVRRWACSACGWSGQSFGTRPRVTLPNDFTMGAVGIAALIANAASFGLLWAYRSGDANMRSAWVCTRNDVFGNLAVLLAAIGVFGTGTGWPDIIVATTMAALALQGAWIVVSQSRAELRISASHDIVMGAK
jgi:hypothetical protein